MTQVSCFKVALSMVLTLNLILDDVIKITDWSWVTSLLLDLSPPFHHPLFSPFHKFYLATKLHTFYMNFRLCLSSQRSTFDSWEAKEALFYE